MSKKTLTKDQLERFAMLVEARRSINFPELAREQGFNWFQDIHHRLDEDWFKSLMDETLQCLKFEIYQRLMDRSMNGRKSAADPEVSSLKEVAKLIDSGELLKRKGSVGGSSPEAIGKHLERMGIGEEE